MRRTRAIALALATGTTALAAPAAARAAIDLDVGMAGFELGMTVDEVSKLGPPTTDAQDRNRNGTPRVRLYYAGPKVQVILEQTDPDGTFTVTSVATRRGLEKTPRGVGVGTAERNLRAKIPGLTCVRAGTTRAPRRLCITRGKKNDTAIGINATFFEISNRTKRVVRISVTRTVD